jgi:predicted metal-dependent phosphoesterase TrpH
MPGNPDYKPHFPSITTLLPKLHPSYREAILKKLKLALDINLFNLSEGEIPTLGQAYIMLGKCAYHKKLIKDINNLVSDGMCSAYRGWTQEVWDLYEKEKKLEKICFDLIGSVMQHSTTPS